MVAYTAVLPVDRAACDWFVRRLAAHRRRLGTRKGTRRLTPWAHAVFTLRFRIDGTRTRQLTVDNSLPRSTAYEYLWEGLEVLVDLGYEKFRAFPAVVVGHKTPKGGKLTEAQKEWNQFIGGKRALAEKANADLKLRFKCLDKVGLNPWRIGTIARACLVFFHIERPRHLTLTQSA